MNFDPASPDNPLIEQFLDALRGLPDVDASLVQPERQASIAGRCDAQIGLSVAGKSLMLLVEVKKVVYPRDVPQIVWQFMETRLNNSNADGKQAVPVLVAESISPGAKERLRDESVGYYDSGGSLYLAAPGIYLYIDKPPPKTFVRSVAGLFSGRRAQVLHALLVRHDDWFGVKDLAELALVSPATASEVLTELERFDWVASRGQGPRKERHLREPGPLLDAWSKQLASDRPLSPRRYYVPGSKADMLLARVATAFDAHAAGYAISHEAAAQRYAPFLSTVSQVRMRLIVDSRAVAAIADLDARVVSEGANLAIIEAKSPGELLFRERVDDAWLASPVQIYLDLLRGEGRSKEMAEHLRKERIGF